MFSAATKFTAVDAFSSTLGRMSRSVGAFSSKATTAFSKVNRSVDAMNKKINNSVKGLGEITGILGAVSAAGFIQTAADATLELDRNVSAAAAKFGVFDRNSKSFEALEKKARELGGTTEFTAGQAAEGLKNLATAGFDAKGAMASLDTVLALATATQSELALSADVAGKSLSAFGLKSEDPKVLGKNLERVSDVLNKIITTTGFGNLEELQTTMGNSGASAKAAGLEIEQWGAIVGTAVSGAIDASSAGSQLNMSLIRLAKPAKEAKKLMKDLEITVNDSSGNFRNIFDIMRDVEKGTKKMGSAQKTAALSTLFGAESSRLHNVLLEKGIDNVEKLSKTYEGAGGTSKKMASLMRSGISGMVASVGSAVQELGISISKTFDTEIKAAVTGLTDAARSAGVWVKENKTLLKFLLKIAKAITMIVIAIKAYVIVTKIATAVTTAYRFALGMSALFSARAAIAAGTHTAAIKGYIFASKAARIATIAFNTVAALNPFVWIAAVVVGIIMLIVHWDKVKKKLESVSDSAGFQFLKMTNPLVAMIDLVRHFQDRWEGIKKAFSSEGMIGGIKAIGRALISFMLTPLQVIIAKLAKFTGSSTLKSASDSLSNAISGLDANLVAKPRNITDTSAPPTPLISNTVTQEQVRTTREESWKKSVLDIRIKDDTDRADVNQSGAPIPLLPSTAGAF